MIDALLRYLSLFLRRQGEVRGLIATAAVWEFAGIKSLLSLSSVGAILRMPTALSYVREVLKHPSESRAHGMIPKRGTNMVLQMTLAAILRLVSATQQISALHPN